MAKKEKKEKFELPQYLRLAKGAMWFDTEGENASGIRLFSSPKIFIGRETKLEKRRDMTGKDVNYVVPTDVPKDEFDNKNILNYGTIDNPLPWYVDTTKIPTEKLSNILVAYKIGILVETDPKNKPKITEGKEFRSRDFKVQNNGDRIFIGKNKEMYKRLQNYKFEDLRKFVISSPLTSTARQNLIDLLDYEIKGYNSLSRARQEVLDLIRKKLNEYGPGMSPLRVNED